VRVGSFAALSAHVKATWVVSRDLRLKRIVTKPPYLVFGKRDGTSES
jgi:hypothetical protein